MKSWWRERFSCVFQANTRYGIFVIFQNPLRLLGSLRLLGELEYMAPFAIPRPGFCMVFQRASVVFSCPGSDFLAWDLIFGSQVNSLARGPFLGKKNVPKKVVLR